MMKGYHFTSNRLRNGEPLPPVGEWLEYTGDIVPCKSGLHMSEHPFDALMYAPGSLLHRVELEGELQYHGHPFNKWVGSRRKILASVDATDLSRKYFRWCALQVIDLWDAPKVVREYLETGDESKRVAAETAACAATYTAAKAAARSAARSAAWAAAMSTAWANAVVYTATKAAARAAADAAADAAAGATVYSITLHKVVNKQRQKFAIMVDKIFN